MGKARPRTLVLDSGALIALERGDERVRALFRVAIASERRVVIPAGVLGQVFRGGSRQVALRALLAAPTVDVPPLDRVLAEGAGMLCARSQTSDVIDACVVLHAQREPSLVLTSDGSDLRRLDPELALELV